MEYQSTDSVIDQPISFCYGVEDVNTKGKVITIRSALDEIKTGKFCREVKVIRELEKESDEQRQRKNELKAYLFSGVFNWRNAKSLAQYSHICILDIDDLTPELLNRHKLAFSEDPFVIAYWVSPRGEGLKGLILFEFSQEPEPVDYPEVHKAAFKVASDYYAKAYGVTLDQHCKDVPRLSFTSSDPDLVLKEWFVTFKIETDGLVDLMNTQPLSKKRKATIKNGVRHDESAVKYIRKNASAMRRREMNSVLKYLKKRGLSITYDYQHWFRVGMAIANTFSYNIGKEYYLCLCRLDGEKHNEGESIQKLIQCYVNIDNPTVRIPITFYTILFLAWEQGYKKFKYVPSSDTVEVEKARTMQ